MVLIDGINLNNLVKFLSRIFLQPAVTYVLDCSRASLADEDRRLPAAVGRRTAPSLPPLTSHPHHRKPNLRGSGLLSWGRDLHLASSALRSLPAALASTLQPSCASYEDRAYRATLTSCKCTRMGKDYQLYTHIYCFVLDITRYIFNET